VHALALALHRLAAVRNHILPAAILALLLPMAAACAQLDGEDEVDDDGTAIEWPTGDKERIWVDGRSVGEAGSQLPGSAGAGAGACACTTAECFDAWVVDAFGCDVCVSFVCDGQEVAHSCAQCDPNPLTQGEPWDGDGDRL
jgi:hypothetical protein